MKIRRHATSSVANLTSRPAAQIVVPAFALAVIACVVYLPAINGGFILDDDDYITQNVHLRSAKGLGKIWFEIGALPDYYPLVHSSFWIEHHLWGDRPLGYHAVNVCLHAINALLLWQILRKLNLPAPWFSAAIFAVHPVAVESVAWIAERKNTLSLLFALASIWCYLRFGPAAECADLDHRPKHAGRYYAASLALFLAALLSKTAVAPLPAVLLILNWWKRGRITRSTVIQLVPFFLLSLVMGLLTIWVESHFNGAHGSHWSFSAAERLLIAARAVCFYTGKAILPSSLSFVYPRWTIDASRIWQWLFPVAASVVAAVLWKLQPKLGRGPLAAAAIFAVVLAPVLGLFNIAYMRFSFVADHFQYYALAAPICLATGAACYIADRCPWKAPLPAKRLAATGLIGSLMLLSWRQSAQYTDAITLYQTTLIKNPDCWLAHYNLANALVAANRPAEAIEHFRQTLRIKPDSAEAHNNLAMQLAVAGDPATAVEHYAQAIKLNPQLADAHANYGIALLSLNRVQEARVQFERTLQLQPQNAEAHNNLGALLLRFNRTDEAIDHFRQAVGCKPTYLQAQFNLAIAYAKMHNAPAAIEAGEKAQKLAETSANLEIKQHIQRWLAQYRSASMLRFMR